MPKPFSPKVVTANQLRDGEVVYLSEADEWVRELGRAEIIEDEAHAQIRLLDGEAQGLTVVGVYLADVRRGPEGPEPAHFREAFRASGPTNYAHGKAHGQRPGPDLTKGV